MLPPQNGDVKVGLKYMISFDSGTNGTFALGANLTLTFAHTVGTGRDTALFVYLFAVTLPTAYNITSVKYAGVSMTEVTRVQVPNDRWAAMYYLANPTPGTNNVVIVSSGGDAVGGCSASYFGVDQTSAMINASTTATAASPATGITTSLTSTVRDCWFVLGCKEDNGTNVTAGTGSTQRTVSADGLSFYDSNSPRNPASFSMTVNGSPGRDWGTVMAAIKPANHGQLLQFF